MDLKYLDDSEFNSSNMSEQITVATDEKEKNCLTLGRMTASKINDIISRAISQNFQGDIVCELKFSDQSKKEEFLKAISE